jgi:hypothetical protein
MHPPPGRRAGERRTRPCREADADWERLCSDVRSCRAEMAEDLGIPQLAHSDFEDAEPHGLALDAETMADGDVIDETAEA